MTYMNSKKTRMGCSQLTVGYLFHVANEWVYTLGVLQPDLIFLSNPFFNLVPFEPLWS